MKFEQAVGKGGGPASRVTLVPTTHQQKYPKAPVFLLAVGSWPQEPLCMGFSSGSEPPKKELSRQVAGVTFSMAAGIEDADPDFCTPTSSSFQGQEVLLASREASGKADSSAGPCRERSPIWPGRKPSALGSHESGSLLGGAGRNMSPELHKAPTDPTCVHPHPHTHTLLTLGHAPSGELSVAKALRV